MMSDKDIEFCNDLKHKCLEAEKDYISQLYDPQDIKNRISFNGFMMHLFNTVFKSNTTLIGNCNSIVDYNNIDMLNYVYSNIYIYFCNKYKIECTQNRFLTMIGIDRATFSIWIKNPSERRFNFAKMVKANSEQALADSMLGGNLMAYAQLKCWHGWTETPQQIQVVGAGQTATPEQIAEKYAGSQKPALIPQDIVSEQ